jgi:adenosylhomocysteinase
MAADPTSDIADVGLADDGDARIEWADRSMPVLARVRERLAKERPFAGLRFAACMHVTTETANLVRALREGGADVALCASNPLSTQDDTAAALVARHGVRVFARSGVDVETYYRHIDAALDIAPDLVFDDGCDLVNTLHASRTELLGGVRGGCEDTTSGAHRLRRMAEDGALRFPMVAVSESTTNDMFDNRYGTGQSTLDGIMRATNLLVAGRTVVVAGYGLCGQGIAERAAGLGARVVVTEVDPVRALDALMQGHQVMRMRDAAAVGDVFVTATGNAAVVNTEHFAVMKDGAVLANAGHFDVEIDVRALTSLAVARRRVRRQVEEYVLDSGRRLLLLAEGRVVNLAAAEGHPPAVMDLSFAVQALSAVWLAREGSALAPGVHAVPADIDREVARLKLLAAGLEIDAMTTEQLAYLRSWRQGS